MAYKIRLLEIDAAALGGHAGTVIVEPIAGTQYVEAVTDCAGTFERWCLRLGDERRWFEVVESVPGPIQEATDTARPEATLASGSAWTMPSPTRERYAEAAPAVYQLALEGGVIRLEDAAWIPPDPAHPDYRRFMDWVAAGNQPLPPDPPQDTS